MSNYSKHNRAGAHEKLALTTTVSSPSPWRQLRIWFWLGVQSFGGGAATLYLIHRAVVTEHAWLSDEEFTRDWSISQISPGINLLCLTILIGWRVGGALGVFLSLLGLLLPSASITILLTALYTNLRELQVVQAALHAVIPATVGLGLMLVLRIGKPLLLASRRESWGSLLLSCVLILASSLALAVAQAPVIGILLTAGALSAAIRWFQHARRHTPDQAQPTGASGEERS
ncbi:MAG: chromate transporter [Chloroflexales bacterium]|nr:chromate transporter [Chloroflexales bacterium]